MWPAPHPDKHRQAPSARSTPLPSLRSRCPDRHVPHDRSRAWSSLPPPDRPPPPPDPTGWVGAPVHGIAKAPRFHSLSASNPLPISHDQKDVTTGSLSTTAEPIGF